MKQNANAIFIDVPAPPPTANTIWRNGQGSTYLSREARDYFQLVALCVRGKKLPKTWTSVSVELIIAPRRRAGDVDNRIKPAFDALTKCGFWKDDSIVARAEDEFAAPTKTGRTLYIIRNHPQGKFAAEFPQLQGDLF